jgi:hypothetical protein
VAADSHGNSFRDSAPYHVPNSRAPEIVKEQTAV